MGVENPAPVCLHPRGGNGGRGIELLVLPVPSETKNQTKTFIDCFVDSFATGLGGLLLIVAIVRRDPRRLYRSFRSERRDMRAAAVELLDNLLAPDLKRAMIPLIEIEGPP